MSTLGQDTAAPASASDSLTGFLEEPSRFLFFTGKGGVGKTSLACATAVALADRGRKVLLVSTDPASNLDEVLGQNINGTPTPIPGAEGLMALNINPEAAAQAYRDRIVGPYRGKLPEAIVRSMEEQMSGACTTEIAAFDEFARLLGEPDATDGFDHVIFDTAPTGHTLRLMTLPTAWTGFLDNNTSGTSCLGPLTGLQKQRAIYERSVAALADGARTTWCWSAVRKRPRWTRPNARAANVGLGVRNQRLILNGVFRACCPEDQAATALELRGTSARQAKGDFPKRLPVIEVPLRAQSIGLPRFARWRRMRSCSAGSPTDVSPTSKSAAGGDAASGSNIQHVAGLETCDTADLEVCATSAGAGIAVRVGGRPCAVGPGCDHDDGQRRRWQDYRGRGHRHGTCPARNQSSPQYNRPGGARRGGGR